MSAGLIPIPGTCFVLDCKLTLLNGMFYKVLCHLGVIPREGMGAIDLFERSKRMAGNIIEVTDSSFEQEVLQSDLPVLVDFWAPWCGPCRAIAPVVEELSTDYESRLKVVKCNVDDNPKVPGKYGIRAIPTLIIFKGGNVSEQITGAVAKSQITTAISKVVV
jgi:thioredoxin 1